MIVIAGTNSGAGKTSICLALAAGLRAMGVAVSPFKVGPDYLDPMYLTKLSDRSCYNLDLWMSDKTHIEQLVAQRHGVALIEGVMGYYDGCMADSSFASTAHVAQVLNSPVILVCQAKAMARSFAALVKGYCSFEQAGQNICGVIANGCSSERHKKILGKALKSAHLPPLVGAIPKGSLPTLKSRHLGLSSVGASQMNKDEIENWAQAAREFLQLDEILRLAGYDRKTHHQTLPGTAKNIISPQKKVRLGIALDDAFNFYYQANLDILEMAGAQLVFFSPLKDDHLPPNLDAIYLGGGYPELWAKELAQNQGMVESIRTYAALGGKVYAECGGLMYLCQQIETVDNKTYPMLGLIPFNARMLRTRKRLGYVEVKFLKDTFLGEKDMILRGHEFHYSEIEPVQGNSRWINVFAVKNAAGQKLSTLGIYTKNILASYVHLYFGHKPEVAKYFVQKIKEC